MKFISPDQSGVAVGRPRKGAWIEISSKVPVAIAWASPPQGGVD